jgi:hypothetical protein
MTVIELMPRNGRSRKADRRLALAASLGDGEEARMIRELREKSARLKATIRALIKEMEG